MKKIWNLILQFFGFGEKEKTAREQADELMAWISSQGRLDESRKQAFQALQKNEISLDERRKHPYEGIISSDCLKVDSAITQFYAEEMSRRFGDAKYLLTLFENGIATVLSSATPHHLEGSIEGKIAQSNPSANKLRDDLTNAKRELNIFKGANGLQKDAEIVDVGNSLYVILAVAIFEAIANIFFLRENTSTPKAILMSLAVAAINVGANVWFGIRYREKNHIDELRSRAGKIFKIYAFLLIFFLNLLIAWFRYVSQDLQIANTNAFLFESIVLLAIGVILGIAAFNKGYALDDPYPDYGPLARKLHELELQWNSLLNQHAEFCESVKQSAFSAHKNVRERINNARNQLMATLPELAKHIEQWGGERRQLNQMFADHQQMFKTTITSNLTGENQYPTGIEQLAPNSQLDHYQVQLAFLMEKKDEIKNLVENLIVQIDESEKNLNTWIKSDEATKLLRWPN
jgi:hypothetical protein